MLYAMLCYGSEAVTSAWTPDQEAKIMAGIAAAESAFPAGAKLGPALRLFPTTTATTLRAGAEPPHQSKRRPQPEFGKIDARQETSAVARERSESASAEPPHQSKRRPQPEFGKIDARQETSAVARERSESASALVLDGPFAETKEQLLGLWIVDCASLEDAIEAGRKLVGARGPGSGSLEIRPISVLSARDGGQ